MSLLFTLFRTLVIRISCVKMINIKLEHVFLAFLNVFVNKLKCYKKKLLLFDSFLSKSRVLPISKTLHFESRSVNLKNHINDNYFFNSQRQIPQ